MFHVKQFNQQNYMTINEVAKTIRNIPNFPKQGIQFKDITTALKNPEALKLLKDETVKLYKDKGITQVVGLESRGFIIGPAVAMELGAGFIPERKPGKLPAETIEISYNKEYGTDTMQIHKDALCKNDVVLLHDDLLATGGTMNAAVQLAKKIGVKKIYVNCIIELEDLSGRELIGPDIEVTSLIKF